MSDLNNLEYFVVNIAKTGKQRNDFFEWAMNHELYKVDNSSSFNSRMKAVYQGKCPTKELTAVISVDTEKKKPIAMILSEDKDEKHQLYKVKNHIKIKVDANIHIVGFLSMFVKNQYRKKGLANKLMAIMELAKTPIFLGNYKDNEHNMMVFEAREKALDVIKKSKKSYAINCAQSQCLFKERLEVFAEHAEAIINKNEKSMYYSNPLIHSKKETPSIGDIQKEKINNISINKLVEKTPLLIKEEIKRTVKKIPTLQPKKKEIL